METTGNSNISGTATGDAGGGGVSSSGMLIRKSGGDRGGRVKMMRFENPFTLKVGQVFTGFGVGCGLGIGVGRPINLGAIPVLNQVMSAASGATHAFSGVGRHVNQSLKKLGAKNIEAGIGCGVGFGHGFGVGLALKPGVVLLQSSFGSRSEKLINSFLQNPELKENKVDKLQSENRMLHMVLKHQQVIEQLLEENENLRKVLVEDLRIPPTKLVSGHNRSRSSACEDCFECIRKQRKGYLDAAAAVSINFTNRLSKPIRSLNPGVVALFHVTFSLVC
ncbi:hypothetical protein AKJ16_DCAP21910 [Drosera capensis]